MVSVTQLLREVLVARYPRAYWRYEEWRIGGLHEQELALLPVLCDRTRLSIDIGANYGMYTSYMIPCSSGCVAFEPLPHLAELLRRGFRTQVRIEQVALSDRSGTTRIRMPVGKPGYSTIEPENELAGKFDPAIEIRAFEVPLRKLDDFELHNVGFIKIDVEGHEGSVLSGASKTIEASRPALLIEVEERHKSGSVGFVHDFLARFGYACFFLRDGLLAPFGAFDLNVHQNAGRPDTYVRNFIFVHGQAQENLLSFFRVRGPLSKRRQ